MGLLRGRPGRTPHQALSSTAGPTYPVGHRVLWGVLSKVQNIGCKVQGKGFKENSLGFRVQGLGSRVKGSGFRFTVLGFGVWGYGTRV